jgi:hypothetical protein
MYEVFDVSDYTEAEEWVYVCPALLPDVLVLVCCDVELHILEDCHITEV